jgi:hypothetical protein
LVYSPRVGWSGGLAVIDAAQGLQCLGFVKCIERSECPVACRIANMQDVCSVLQILVNDSTINEIQWWLVPIWSPSLTRADLSENAWGVEICNFNATFMKRLLFSITVCVPHNLQKWNSMVGYKTYPTYPLSAGLAAIYMAHPKSRSRGCQRRDFVFLRVVCMSPCSDTITALRRQILAEQHIQLHT